MKIKTRSSLSFDGERMEKWVLRKAFEDYLPDEILWRQKEQFSDGVGYSWIDTLKEVVEDMISDQEMKDAKIKFEEFEFVWRMER